MVLWGLLSGSLKCTGTAMTPADAEKLEAGLHRIRWRLGKHLLVEPVGFVVSA